MNIATILRERAHASGDAPAIVERSGAIGFAALDRAAARAAADLTASGLGPGDHVLVLVPVSIPLYAVLVGLFRMGGTAVLLDPSAGRQHIERCCALARPRGFVGAPMAHLLRIVSRAMRAIPIALTAGGRLPGVRHVSIDGNAPDGSIAAVTPETPALLTFTSGSTGEPKGVVRSHGFLRAQHRVLEDALGLRAGELQLTALPVFVLSNLATGVTSVLPDADLRRPGDIDAAPVLFQIRTLGAQSIVASPAMLERLAEGARSTGDLAGVERIFTGGAPVFPRVLRALRGVAPRAALVAVYGSTEAEPIARIAFDDMSDADLAAMRAGAGLLAGIPVPGTDVRVIADRVGTPIGPFTAAAFDDERLPAGQAGEIVVAGDHVLTAYLHGRGRERDQVPRRQPRLAPGRRCGILRRPGTPVASGPLRRPHRRQQRDGVSVCRGVRGDGGAGDQARRARFTSWRSPARRRARRTGRRRARAALAAGALRRQRRDGRPHDQADADGSPPQRQDRLPAPAIGARSTSLTRSLWDV